MQRERERESLTNTPSLLATNKYKKFPINSKAVTELIWERSKFRMALKSTTEVASFTTPSPKTKLYNKGVSSWLSTCIHDLGNKSLFLNVLERTTMHEATNTCKVQSESVAENIAPIATTKGPIRLKQEAKLSKTWE